MASKIQNLTMREICEQYGVLGSKYGLATALSAYSPDMVRIEKFFETMFPLSNFNGESVIIDRTIVGKKFDFDKLISLMSEYEDIFDKELLIFKLYKSAVRREECVTLDGIVGTKKELDLGPQKYTNAILTRNGSRDYDRWIREYGRLLKGVDIVDGSEDIQYDNGTCEILIKTSQDYIGNSKSVLEKNKYTEKRFQQIEKKIDLRELIHYITPSDLVDICRYPVVGNKLKEKIMEMPYDYGKKQLWYDISTGKDIPLEEANQRKEVREGKIYSVDNFYKVFQTNRRYMNPDKLLAIALETYYQAIVNSESKTKYEEVVELKEFSRKIQSLLEDKEICVQRNIIGATPFADVQKTTQNINDLLSSFINRKPCSKQEIELLRMRILLGDVPYNKISLGDYFNAMKYNTREFLQISSHHPEALSYFITSGLVTKKGLQEFLETSESLSDREVLILYRDGIIDNDKLLDLYNSSKVSFDNIKYLSKELENPADLVDIVSAGELIELYKNSERREEFDKYRKLYKYFKLEGKTVEEKNDIGLEIIEACGEQIDEETIKELYHMGILTCDLMVDLMDASTLEETVQGMYSQGELNPTDARRLFDRKKIITPQMLCAILTDSKISDEQKIVLVYSTFPKPTDVETREALFIVANLLDVENSIHKGQGSGIKRRKGEGTTKKKDYTPSDPCARWNLLSKLDDEYSEDLLKDGTIIFFLPNSGKYIIEKLFVANHQPAYGAATYILGEDIYKKYEARIIQDGRINRSQLVDLNIGKQAAKYVHRGWGKAICREFDIDNPSVCPPEKSKEIKAIAREVEESKKPREI